jgi:replicative DNA helicase
MSWINAHDLDVVFVDYLQMMHDKTFRGSRNDELGNIAREFRKMSINRCFVVLSQFNRSREEEDEIDMSRIRDSGEIEQTSTSVILIRRDKKEKEKFYYAVAKNQSNGKLTYGWVPLSFETGGKFKETDSDDI